LACFNLHLLNYSKEAEKKKGRTKGSLKGKGGSFVPYPSSSVSTEREGGKPRKKKKREPICVGLVSYSQEEKEKEGGGRNFTYPSPQAIEN